MGFCLVILFVFWLLIFWYIGMLLGIYMFVVFVFALLWGCYFDWIGCRLVILVGFGGFVLVLVLFGFLDGFLFGYFVCILVGVFVLVVLFVILVYVVDMSFLEWWVCCFVWMSVVFFDGGGQF